MIIVTVVVVTFGGKMENAIQICRKCITNLVHVDKHQSDMYKWQQYDK